MKTGKAEKLVANWHDKKEYVIHIRNLKQALNHGQDIFFQYSEELHKLHKDLTFFLDRMITKKVEKLVVNWHDKKEYITHIRNLDKTLNHILKKVQRVVKSNQEAWLKPYTEMNTGAEKKSKK